jgi:large subunit ribosomal protein L18
MYIQLIDDTKGVTLVAASTKELEGSNGGNKGAAFEVGKLIGTKAIEKGIKTVVFDRSGYIYHGRVKEVADGAREAGLEF